MAAKTWNVASGLWSVGSNWNPTGVPVDLDTVTIPAGTACTFDVDQSSWANGLGDMVINGELNFDTSGATRKYLKMAGHITGAPNAWIRVGTEANPVQDPGSWAGPGESTVTIAFNGAYVIDTSMNVEMWGDQREPGYPIASKVDNYTIVLAEDTGTWLRPNDLIAISDSTIYGAHSPADETFIVDAYDPVTRTITLNSSTPLPRLVNQNGVTDYVALVSHNIMATNIPRSMTRFHFITGYNNKIVGARFYNFGQNPLGGHYWTANYCSFHKNGIFYNNRSGKASKFVVLAGNSYSTYGMNGYGENGIFINTSNALGTFSSTLINCLVFGGTLAGPGGGNLFISCNAFNAGLTQDYANNNVFINCNAKHVESYLFSRRNANNVFINCGDSSDCTYAGDHECISAKHINCVFNAPVEVVTLPPNIEHQGLHYIESINHNLSGIYKAWSSGGITISQSTTVPPDKLIAYQSNCASSTYWTYVREELQLLPGQKLNVWGAIKLSATGFTNGPVFELVDKDQDPLNLDTYSALDTWTASDTTDWQYGNLSYENTNNYPITVYIRCRAIDASKTFYSAWDYQVIDENTKALLPERLFYNQPAWTPSLKLALLTGYTYNSSHKTWSDVSSYEISPTGDYVAGGLTLTSTFNNGVLSINDTSVYLVSANVSHMVIYDTYRNNLILAIKFVSPLAITNDYLTVDFTQDMIALIYWLGAQITEGFGLYLEIEIA